MTEKQFQEKWEISKAKLLKMAPYIEGAKQCPNCKKWEFPDNAIAIYIPNKTHYGNNQGLKDYAYVLDAIEAKMELNEEISGVQNDIVKTVVRELKKKGAITLIEGRKEDSLYHLDYHLSADFIKWKEKKTAQKRKQLIQVFDFLKKAVKLAANCAKILTGF